MARLTLIAAGLLASAFCAARPMVIHQTQTLSPPPGAGYDSFGRRVAIDGDWAIVTAATPSPTSTIPPQTHDALLYRHVNGRWTLDRVLDRRVATTDGYVSHIDALAMNNGAAAIGPFPTRVFRRTNNTWTEIAHPFTAPPDHPDFVAGELEWDGNTLLAARRICISYSQQLWGARISRLNADGSWSALERLSGDDPICTLEPRTGASPEIPWWRAPAPTTLRRVRTNCASSGAAAPAG